MTPVRRYVIRRPTPRREPPVHFDPVATYDAQFRKQPKRIGFIEVARVMPGILDHFSGRVPGDRFVITDDDQAVFDCVCGEVVYAATNAITDCDCGRSFVLIGRQVLVHRPDPGDAATAP